MMAESLVPTQYFIAERVVKTSSFHVITKILVHVTGFSRAALRIYDFKFSIKF